MPANPTTADQRHSQRVTIPEQPQVINAHTGDIAGQLVNLSVDGLMLSSNFQIKCESILQLRIPLLIAGQEVEISLGAESLWSEDANGSGTYWTGFQIIDISPEDKQTLERIVSS